MPHLLCRTSIILLCTTVVFSFGKITAQSQPLPLANPSACNLWVNLGDDNCGSPLQLPIQVSSAPGAALGTDVYLEEIRLLVSHGWLADVEARLVSPSGKTVLLIDEVGGGNDHFGDPNSPNCDTYTTLISHTQDINCGVELITEAAWPYLGEYLPIGNFSTFNDGTSPIGNWTLELCDDEQVDTGSLQYVELVFAAANCLQPTDLQVVAVDSNSVQIDWVPGALNCSNTVIEYGPPGFMPGTNNTGSGTVVFEGCPPAIVTGLTASSVYEIYVRQNCGGANFSSNSCPVQFSTTCSPAPPTLVEDFNAQVLCSPYCGVACDIQGFWQNSMIDSDGFDWIVQQDSTSTSGTGPTDDFPGGGKYVYIDYSAIRCHSGDFAGLISQCVEVKARPDTCDFSFDYTMFGVHVQTLVLQVTTDGGQTWTDLWQLSGDQGPAWKRAYVDLDSYDGLTVQFRFMGEGGNAKKGDIALDNLTFYGSTAAGGPVYTYYKDIDGDGYGGQSVFYQACQPFNLSGFVPDSTDCDDNLAFINPGMPESPCDFFDFNCDPSDEFDLPPPAVTNDTVCSGDVGAVMAMPSQFGGVIHWYGSATDTVELGTGTNYSPPNFPVNPGTAPITLTFFAEETSADSCRSVARSEGHIVILPQPQISTMDNPSICAGAPYDLTTIDVIDAAGANGSITFHSAFPANAGNEISPFVFPTGNENYYIASTPIGGCTDVASVTFNILPTPQAEIAGPDFICFEATGATLTSNDVGNGLPPVAVQWNTGQADPAIMISPNINKGATDEYILTLTGSNGCADTDTLAVTTLTSVDSVTINVTPVGTCGGGNGEIQLTPQNGQAPFTYFWEGASMSGSDSGQFGTYSLSGLPQGAYSFTITDSSPEGCSFTLPIVAVDGPGAILTDSGVTPVKCNGGSDGCIEIDVVGTAPMILWDNGQTTELVCGLSAGNHTVTITDGSCQTELDFMVPEPDKILVNPTVTHLACNGNNNGSIALSVFNGNGNFQYAWQHGPVTPVVQNLFAGNYAVTITDSKGCTSEIPFISVNEPLPLDYQIDLLGQPSCASGNDGQIVITPLGGTAPFDVDWSNAGMGTTINSLAAGTYDVSIDDANGCFFTDQITLPEPLPISILLDNAAPPQCNGIDDGTLEITASGGDGNFTFEWSNGLSSEDLVQMLGPGSYAVTATDGMGCTSVSEDFALAENPFLVLSVTDTNPPCVGVNWGSIAVNVASGGVAPYSFNWSTNDSGPYVGALSPGGYTVTVTDDVGCMFDSTITLTATQVLDVTWVATDPACFSSASGQIDLNVAGGTQPYQILWSDTTTQSTIDSLPSGNYTATVTDAQGCKFFTPLIPLKEPGPLLVTPVTIEDATCFGDTDGSIDVAVSGGTAPVALLWSNADTSASISGLAPDVYFVTATDSKGCVNDSISVPIFSPPLLEAEPQALVEGCTSFSTDTICLEVQGGVLPYQFEWSEGTLDACLTNSPVGDYSVTVTDASGCVMELMSVKVSEDVEVMSLSETAAAGLDSICAGAANGEVQVQVDGGQAPYQFIWSNGDVGISNNVVYGLSGLSGGIYQLTLTDDNGCTKVSEMMTVTEADSVEINAPGFAQTPVNCHGGSDGGTDISVFGGYFPYQFYWENSAGDSIGNTEDLSNILAGEYFVTVTDQQGCSSTISVNVVQPAQALGFDPVMPATQNETCFGYLDGRIDLGIIGGTPPYTYIWSTGDTTSNPTLDALPPGNYFVTVEDANLCAYFSSAIEIFGPETHLQLLDFTLADASCFGASDGFIDLTMLGGTSPYVYQWNPASSDEDLTGIPAGQYDLTVFDENLCQYDTAFEIFEPSELLLFATASLAASGDGTIVSSATGGMPPYLFELPTGEMGDTITGLSPGWYNVIVTDANFCQQNIWVEIPQVSATGDQQEGVSYLFFPNPTSGSVQLLVKSENPLKLDLQVFDALGQMILEKNAALGRETTIPFDLSELPSGVYFAIAKNEGQIVVSERLIVGR